MKEKLTMSKLRWPLMLLGLAIASGFIYFYNIEGYERSEFYAAVPNSMSMSWSNFFFGSLDPAGTVTLDKIPGSYWVPAIFVKLFGFSTASITIPNGLATVGAVLAIAFAGKRIAEGLGDKLKVNAELVGLLAGGFIAVTPIISAIARSNQPESFFILMMALAFHRGVVALQQGSRKQLVYAGLFIAGAFQCYMIEAWVIWPALIVAWFAIRGRKTIKKIVDLLIAGSISLITSLAWLIVVSLIPANSRPYIGSTLHNSAWEMVFGYNALGRFSSSSSDMGNSNATAADTFYRSFTPPFSGSAGWLRLFNTQVAGQIAWFLIPAAVALALILIRKHLNSTVIFIGLSLVIMYVEYSMVAGMHQFYVSALALPCALVLAYFMVVARAWMFAVLGVISVAWTFYVASMYSGYMDVMPYVAALILVPTLFVAVFSRKTTWAMALGLALAIGVAPAAWSADVSNHASTINPMAGPDTGMGGMGSGGFGGNGGPGGNFGGGTQVFGPGASNSNSGSNSSSSSSNGQGFGGRGGNFGGGLGGIDTASAKALVKWLKANVTGSPKYLLAVFGAQSSASIINATGASVMPIGGFDGSDPAPTLAQFKALVKSGDVQYVQLGSQAGFMGGGNSTTGTSAEIQSWVTANCTAVADSSVSNIYHCTK